MPLQKNRRAPGFEHGCRGMTPSAQSQATKKKHRWSVRARGFLRANVIEENPTLESSASAKNAQSALAKSTQFKSSPSSSQRPPYDYQHRAGSIGRDGNELAPPGNSESSAQYLEASRSRLFQSQDPHKTSQSRRKKDATDDETLEAKLRRMHRGDHKFLADAHNQAVRVVAAQSGSEPRRK